jgi:hypothetical protein
MGDVFGAAALPEGAVGALEKSNPPWPSPAPNAAAPALRVPQQTPHVVPTAPPAAGPVLRVPARSPLPPPVTPPNRRRTKRHRQPIRRSNRNRRPSRKQREAFKTALAVMTCPDRCPNPDQTLRDDITHAALSVGTGEHAEYQALLKSSDGPLWERSCTEDIARLAQGFPPGGIPASEGTHTIRFIKVSDIPEGRKATYVNICSPDRPQKEQAPSPLHRGRRSTMRRRSSSSPRASYPLPRRLCCIVRCVGDFQLILSSSSLNLQTIVVAAVACCRLPWPHYTIPGRSLLGLPDLRMISKLLLVVRTGGRKGQVE